jgi:tetratricopeptide (TPR) repeat protein
MDKAALQFELQQMDTWIQQGKSFQARKRMYELKSEKIPRELLVEFSAIARRLRVVHIALRKMQPIIRNEKIRIEPPSEQEKAIYASLLTQMGAHREAAEILKSVSFDLAPEAALYLAFHYIFLWEYQKALRPLKRYIRSSGLSLYQKTVGELNIAACYVRLNRHQEAEKLLQKLRRLTKDNDWALLYANTLEVSTQMAIFSDQWKLAEKFLEEARGKIRDKKSQFALFLAKWDALSAFLQEANHHNQQELKKVRAWAQQIGHWETLRDLDWYEALILKKKGLLKKVYLGTAHQAYRTYIVKQGGFSKGVPRVWQQEGVSRVFDMKLAKEEGKDFHLKVGQALHRLLLVLTSDLYRSFMVGEVFSKVFPGEYFNIETSPQRIQKLVYLLRKEFRKNDVPVKILVQNSSYHLRVEGDYGFRLHNLRLLDNPNLQLDLFLSEIQKNWPYQSFRNRDVAKALNLPKDKVMRWTAKLEKQKKLKSKGYGKGKVYQAA